MLKCASCAKPRSPATSATPPTVLQRNRSSCPCCDAMLHNPSDLLRERGARAAGISQEVLMGSRIDGGNPKLGDRKKEWPRRNCDRRPERVPGADSAVAAVVRPLHWLLWQFEPITASKSLFSKFLWRLCAPTTACRADFLWPCYSRALAIFASSAPLSAAAESARSGASGLLFAPHVADAILRRRRGARDMRK
eukprot:scaffold1850_cov194-Pinguiococcus_pyrenoidosus.AAC.35